MRRRLSPALGLLVLALGGAGGPSAALPEAPAGAAPRISLHLEGATLHQVLLKLNEATGLQLRDQAGAGGQGFIEPPNSRRARIDWKEAPLGRVVREICAVYGLTAASMGDSGYWFTPGSLPKRAEVFAGGVAFSIGSVNQWQNAEVTPGRAAASVNRGLSVQLVCRAEDGEAEVLGPLTRIAAIDDRGVRHEGRPSPYHYESQSSLPDERARGAWIPWSGPHAARLQRIEGELAFYDRYDEHRLAVPLPTPDRSIEKQLGPALVKVERLALDPASGGEIQVRVEWPADAQVQPFGRGGIQVFLKGRDGRPVPLTREMRSGLTPGGAQYAHLTLAAQLDEPPASFEVIVPVRSGTRRRVSFALNNVALPYGRPFQPRLQPLNLRPRLSPRQGPAVPAVFQDRDGGTILIPGLEGPAAADTIEISIGLSRRGAGAAWSPVRWTESERGEEPLRIAGVAPGRYRVYLRSWSRSGEGPRRRLPGSEQPVELDVRAGAEARVSLPATGGRR